MSCYICEPETVSMIADAIAQKLTVTINYDSYKDDREAFYDCFDNVHFVGIPGMFDTHKIYRKLYIENLKAYNGRYNENVREFKKYAPQMARTKMQLHKIMHEYLYQIAEDATYRGPIYKAVEHIMYTVADEIATQQWETQTWD